MGQPTPKGHCRAEPGGRHVDKSSEWLAGEVHGPDVSSPDDSVKRVDGDAQHQIPPYDAAAHTASVEKRQTTEHLAFGDPASATQRLANTSREPLVVRHDSQSVDYARTTICLP